MANIRLVMINECERCRPGASGSHDTPFPLYVVEGSAENGYFFNQSSAHTDALTVRGSNVDQRRSHCLVFFALKAAYHKPCG